MYNWLDTIIKKFKYIFTFQFIYNQEDIDDEDNDDLEVQQYLLINTDEHNNSLANNDSS